MPVSTATDSVWVTTRTGRRRVLSLIHLISPRAGSATTAPLRPVRAWPHSIRRAHPRAGGVAVGYAAMVASNYTFAEVSGTLHVAPVPVPTTLTLSPAIAQVLPLRVYFPNLSARLTVTAEGRRSPSASASATPGVHGGDQCQRGGLMKRLAGRVPGADPQSRLRRRFRGRRRPPTERRPRTADPATP